MTRPIKVADVTHYTDRAGRKIKRRFLSPEVMDNARDTAFNESLPSPIEEPRAIGFQVRLVLESLKRVSERRAGLIRELYSPGDVGVESAFLDLRNVSEHTLELAPGTSSVVRTAVSINLTTPNCVGVITGHPMLAMSGGVLQNPIMYLEPQDHSEVIVTIRNVSLEHILYIQPGEAVAQYAVMHRFQLKPDFVSWFT